MTDRFGPALRRLDAELDLPPAVRAEILLEMAADLDAVYAHHRASGLPEAEAARRAEESVLGSSEVIRRLARLHRGSRGTWPGALAERLARAGGGLDLALLTLGVLPILGLAASGALSALRTSPTDPLVWLLSTLGAAVLVVGFGEVARLRRIDECDPGRLSTLLVLSVLAPAAGLLAAAVRARAGFMRLSSPGVDEPTAAVANAATGAAVGQFAAAAATLTLGLLLGLAGVLWWFGLVRGAGRRATRRLDAVLALPARSVPGPQDDGAPAIAHVVPLHRRRSS